MEINCLKILQEYTKLKTKGRVKVSVKLKIDEFSGVNENEHIYENISAFSRKKKKLKKNQQ